MKNRLCIMLLFSILMGGCESANNQKPSTKYEEKKASLADTEREGPLKFLKISGSHRGNLINQTVVEGEILNKATLTTYKNITVQITFIDKEGSTIEKQKHVLDDEIEPGGTLDFKIKTGHVKETKSVSIDITDALADK